MFGSQVGRRTAEKAKIICPPPSGVDIIILTFEIPAAKSRHGVEVNWSQNQDTGVTDPALK